MPILLTDSQGVPVPQYLAENGNTFEYAKGASGSMYVHDTTAPLKSVSDLSASNCYSVQLVGADGTIIDLNTFELKANIVGAVPIIHGTPTDKQVIEVGTYTGDKMSNSVYIGQAECLMVYLNITSGSELITGVDLLTNVNNKDVILYSCNISVAQPTNIIGMAKHGSSIPNVIHHTPPHSFKVRVRCTGSASYDVFIQVL